MILLTNNAKFLDEERNLFVKKITLEFLEEDYIGVLKEARKLIHQGFELLTHPLYGSIKPNETLYRSLVLKEGKEVDVMSLNIIEDSINTATKFIENKSTPQWTNEIKEDFKLIDYDIISQTICRI
ncbi:GrdX family protein [Peptostreptococcus faecalis]|uniref:GrdX family protein n=1 Tax=Peptostreptococcus faecalis TaxID=2045015 RepID=UPI000C7AA064|nr:GrdX family protein [Peptostreptococcus faecalis]